VKRGVSLLAQCFDVEAFGWIRHLEQREEPPMGTRYRGRAAEVRALDAYIKLLRATRSVTARLERTLANEGVTDTQFGALEALYHLGPLCQRELGKKLLKSGANVTTVIDNLEKRGLVQRVRQSDDRRFVAVHLTAEGRALVQRVLPLHVAGVVDAFSGLQPPEQEQLDRLCKKLGLWAAGY
jgi:MarR family 2-MHQ and catechol resistance regulon transcriptional repressor